MQKLAVIYGSGASYDSKYSKRGQVSTLMIQVSNIESPQLEIGQLFQMDYSAVSQTAKRFDQKSRVDNEIKESMQKVITALKEK